MTGKKNQIEGIIVPLVTPFDAEDRIDGQAISRLVDFVISEGADYLMPTALTGEGPLLTEAENLEVWDKTFEAAKGRKSVIPAIVSTTTRQAVALAKAAERLGAPAMMAAPIVPELYAGRSEKDVRGFYQDVAAAAALPIILFNYPSLTGVDLTPSFVAKLAEMEAVTYIKESTGDSKRVHAIHRLCGDGITVICGNPNAALESMALGCRAWITGILNVVPRSGRLLMDAIFEKGDLSLARRIYYRQILPLVDTLDRNNNPTGTIKAGLRARGVDAGAPRRPGNDVSTADAAWISSLVKDIAEEERHES
jgi:4-hydroxy-tetrahydrodipicolinate synthase